MKQLTILGVIALFLLLLLPGAVSAADVMVSGSVVDEDLTVTAISPNVGVGGYMFANEPNVISVTITNNGGLDAGASTVEVVVGTDTYTAAVPAITAGGSQTVMVTDTVSRTYASGPVSVTATADSDDVIDESDETNNAMTSDLTIYYNGYKGKRFTDGSDIVTYETFELRGDVLYSTGDSVYFSGSSTPWTTYTTNWASGDLPVPGTATGIEEARLYVFYTWDKVDGIGDVSLSFNGEAQTLAAIYSDTKSHGSSDYPCGMLAYDVTSDFNSAGNTAVLTNSNPVAGNPSLKGMVLVVVYEDGTETLKQIIVNEEYDMLYGGSTKGTTPEEATAYAPFGDLDTSGVSSATLITVAPGGDGPEGTLIFNGQTWMDVWSYIGATNLAIDERDVTSYLQATDNIAAFQSDAEYIEGSNAILVLEQTEAAVTADFSGTPTSGDKPLTVAFTDESTGYITGYAWDFGDGETSTDASPSHEYTARGTYTVSLTVTGVDSSDTETKTDYITVTEPAPVVDFSADETTPLVGQMVTFTATNTGGQVDSWLWNFGDGQTSTDQNPTHQYTSEGTFTVSLTATGPDYFDTETKTNYIQVGAAIIDVTLTPTSIDFGTMSAGVDETGSTTVNVDVTEGTAWSVTASASNSGYMGTGSVDLANPFQLSNDGSNFQAMTSNFADFLTGSAGVDGSGTADVLQSIDAADAPGSYSITLTFTGGFV